MLPDELEHQQLVEIGIQQGTRDRIQFPVMIVRAPGDIDNHNVTTLSQQLSLDIPATQQNLAVQVVF